MTLSLLLLAANVLISITCFRNRELFFKLDFQPYMVVRNNQWYRFISHAFVHADGYHLVVNMYVLYAFGKLVESGFAEHFGQMAVPYFVLLYVGGILFSSIPGFVRNRENYNYHGVGASGAVSAIVFAFILMEPFAPLSLIFIPFFGLYLVYEVYMDRNRQSNIAHSAHYFGAIFGIVFTAAMKPDLILQYLP